LSNGGELAKKKWKSKDRSVSERSERASFQKRFVQLRLKFGAYPYSCKRRLWRFLHRIFEASALRGWNLQF